ncbi:MAG: alpha-N-arabinofuranosidase [Bacteroidetes bacterium RBG_13_42_15]|nr:MAG: alpha-N-arabinofuranosidase [Bacteroidetes bacterium RBG_13_42_15]
MLFGKSLHGRCGDFSLMKKPLMKETGMPLRNPEALCVILLILVCNASQPQESGSVLTGSGVSVLLVDTDMPVGKISEGIYGQFLEHINHSVVDGLYAEQVQGMGFEGEDFETYWKPYGENGSVTVVNTNINSGEKSIQLKIQKASAGIRQNRIFLRAGYIYNGFIWVNIIDGSPKLTVRFKDNSGRLIEEIPLRVSGRGWKEIPFSFNCTKTDTHSSLEIEASGTSSLLIDLVSLMREDIRKSGMLRPDLFKAIDDLKAPFIRWPGGSFASTYRWKDGIGSYSSRKYHPNIIWGGYSDYYGFGTDEFMEFCRQLDTEPLIVLPAPGTNPEDVKYAMDWVHYLNDPITTELGKLRASNGHTDPYNVKYFQIDNEPMNNNFTAEQYACIVNVYGSALRKIAPEAEIVACGQKRSNDLNWSQKVIDIAGDNFDILGCHNYEYENDNYQTGLFRIENYLVKLRDFIRNSKHPDIKLAILEWGLCRTYDWRAGLHAAGSLIMYEKMGEELSMTCPALLMRNTTDDPTWTAFIYHDHVSWFPGAGYVVEKLFREHYADNYLASASGTFSDIKNRNQFFNDISQMKPENWKTGTMDAIAACNADGKQIIIKAVNYENYTNTLLVRFQGSTVTDNADVNIFTLKAELSDRASIENPDVIKPKESSVSFSRDMNFEVEPYSVVVIDIIMK